MQLLPEKHVRLNETYIGLGAYTLDVLEQPMTLDALWQGLREIKSKKKSLPDKISFEDLILTINFLFAIRAINVNSKGDLFRCA